MSQAQNSLISEVESAIATGSADKRVDALRRITDLFMVRADEYSDDQVEVFDDVIARLAEQIEAKARAELARRLAPVSRAPVAVIRKLALDQSMDVAEPVLRQSPRLTEEDLLTVVQTQGQDRLLAISRRATVSEAISDVLVTRGSQEVVRSVARNEGARFSSAGFGRLVERSAGDDELTVVVGMRKDVSKEHFQALIAKASDAVFKKLSADNPAAAGELNRVLFGLTGHNAGETPAAPVQSPPRDYTAAKTVFDALKSSGKRLDAALQQFASVGRFEEVVFAIASLCQLPIEVVERVLSDRQSESDLALLLIKAAELKWPTAKAILEMRRGEGGLPYNAAETARAHFDRLQTATAKRVVRFYQVRRASGEIK
ncbi:DUF2336 domain-containing protein [Rhodoplanes sp. Z2-YC6860]|uniref:DUF2336 domain-containing protein n=1 Tax=Rhodoplanes sp. Z2-YC6860 TaxID=674703 RepID=UPI00078BEC46|nr:DUF2336 domain-containing protein [Rhodoplanes sp. Z2-YC6860]AMN40306.1 hypothetical protein RHPLAN_18550 [Rhodoplanes sp. Z2-YC6860]